MTHVEHIVLQVERVHAGNFGPDLILQSSTVHHVMTTW